MGISAILRSVQGWIVFSGFSLTLAATTVGEAAAQNFAPYDPQPGLSLGRPVVFDTKVDRLETPAADPLKANDIAVAPGGKIWIASDHGLLEQAGFGWNLRPVTPAMTKELLDKYGAGSAYGEKPKVRVGVRRIDIDPKTGDVWIVDADGRLAVLEKDVWRLVGTQIRDFGVYDGKIWAIPTVDPANPRATDGAILTGTREKYEAFYGWHNHLGEPTAIDVAPDGVAWITTSSGLLVRSHTNDNSRPGVWTIQGTPDCLDLRTGSAAGCANSGRRLTDVAVIDAESAWVTGTDREGPVARLFTNGLRLSAGLADRRSFKALASNELGHLTALSDTGAPIHAPLVLSTTASTPEAAAKISNEFARPDRSSMRAFGEGTAPVVLPIPAARAGAAVDHAAALNPSNNLTIAFAVMPAEGGPGTGTTPQCLVSLASSQRETFSICLDAAQTKMTVRVGETEKTVPVTIGSVLRDGKPVAQRFVLQAELGEARLYTVDETWKPDATFPSIQILDKATVRPLTNFAFRPIRTDTSSNLKLTFGGRTATADLFRGHLGPVRIWRRGDLDPGVVFRVHDAGHWSTAQSPAPLDLIVDAPLVVEGDVPSGGGAAQAFLYQHCKMGGYSITLPPGDYSTADLVAKGVADNDLSSIVLTPGTRVTLYDGDNLSGNSVEITEEVVCLTAKNFNDMTSSLKVAGASSAAAPSTQTEARTKLLSPIDLSGIWASESGEGEYDLREISASREAMAFSAGRIEVFRIRGTRPDPASPFGTGGLDVFRDGEGGVVISRFIQTASDTFVSWRHPQTGRFASGFKPFELKVVGAGRVRVTDPNSGNSALFQRVGEPSNKGGPRDEIAKPYDNFIGYDIMRISPILTSLGGSDRRRIFSNQRFDEAGAPVETPTGRTVPWGLLYNLMDRGASSNTERVIETTRELQEDLSASVGLGAEMPEVFSFSVSADFKESVKRMVDEKSVLAIGEVWHAAYGLMLDPARVSLEPDFRSLVEGAADAAAGQAQNGLIDEILDIYGAHYTNFVVFGCRARYERKITETSISNEIEREYEVAAESSGTVSGVTLSLEGKFGRGTKSAFEKTESAEDTRITTEAATVSFDAEEVTCGEENTRGNPISRDLRPITDVLSPVYFDNPKVYRDLRNAVGLRAIERLRAANGRVGVSDVSALPELYVVTLESLSPANLGSDNAVEGTVSITYTPAGSAKPRTTPLWSGSGATAARPSAAEGGAVAIGKRAFLSVDPGMMDANLTAELTGMSSSEVLGKVTENLYLDSARARGAMGNVVAAISAGCQCVTACPDGYADEDGSCLKTCPADFDTVAGGTCFGSYPRTFYTMFELDDCNKKWPSLTCVREGEYLGTEWAVYPKCKPGFRSQAFGWCQAKCTEFGLEGWGGTDITCSRPEASRTTQGRSPSNSCPAGATPGVDCARVGIAYTVQKVVYVD